MFAMPSAPPKPPSRRIESGLVARLLAGNSTAGGSTAGGSTAGGSTAGGSTAGGSTAEFWATVGQRTPVVEDAGAGERRVTFLWRSAEATAVYVTINRVTHDLDDSRMERVPDTDVWHATFRLPADWRGSYTMLETDTAGDRELHEHEPHWAMRTIRDEGVVDPRNPVRTLNHCGIRASVAELDAAPRQSIAEEGPSPRAQRLVAPSGRTVWLSPPIDDDGGAPRPLVLVLDGEVWHASGYAAAAADRLGTTGTIRAPFVAMVATGATSPQRMSDLSIDGTMSDEIATSLLPWLRDRLPVSADPRDVVVTGESLGGLTALKTAFDHPEVVGSALSQSASLWQYDMLDRAATVAPVHLFLTVGTFEGTLLEPHRRLCELLVRSPHTVTYREFQGGHDMACWRGFWEDGIADLLGRPRR